MRWTDDQGRLAEVAISDEDAERLRRGQTVAAFSSEEPRRGTSSIDDLDREIARLEHQQREIRRELDDLVTRYPEAKSL